ncbi:PREDICTED: histone-lysine N-methyltransferase SETD2-like isoform X2 [Amphimedon queenslandica]|uniref:[histone H3]-lysine(36) N-trimethyltransferase n=1 Tax=Amphimedon queenslandica TaxID=400682 RepID=A0A1X7UJK2_AMPQE|nr:PREDICTED: histone-lysine N-methyltransferase SETD2-like isoform X2 [Amphimedon queenslandica]|eukprot:XP_019853842.1 PREDICTED: histone-lysine N-methyltransferase SETD2-like isoform X2 [Amphimedon queenslandica]
MSDEVTFETVVESPKPLTEPSEKDGFVSQHISAKSMPLEGDDSSPPSFDFITENVYIVERGTTRDGKRSKRMMCTCQFDPETDNHSEACGENCLNRLLMIECGSRCPCGEYCTNKRFTRSSYANVEVIKTEMKGWGLKATCDISRYSFVMEYCGEVCSLEEFERRRNIYEKESRRHYYFMSLKTDEILDATRKGNLSRFINHSCEPNCETQKWTVNGRLRVGFFALRHIPAGEELTFDYQFQRFGESVQKCYCGSETCRGFLGAKQTTDVVRSDMYFPTRDRKAKRRCDDADSMFEKEIYDVVGSTWRLKNSDQVLSLSRLMLRAESIKQRRMLLKVLQATKDNACLKRFLSFQGLRLLWSWMVEVTDQQTSEALDAKIQILLTLQSLPVPNRNVLKDNKIWQLVQKWSEPSIPSNSHNQDSVVIREADCSISQDNIDGENKHLEDCPEKVVKVEAEILETHSDLLSEAESREAVASFEDEESRVVSIANDLLEKWNSLKEVFRIPKKILSDDVRSKEKKVEESDEDNRRKRKRESKWDTSEGYQPTNTFTRPGEKVSQSYYVPQSRPPARTGLLGPPPPSIAGLPLQNTVIVQHQSGQSVYVQQQIFPTPSNFPQGMLAAQYAPVNFPPPTLPLPVINLDSAPLPVTSMQSQLLEVTPKPTLEPSNSLIPPTVRNAAANVSATIPPPPPVEKPLPQNWKEVKEPSGKVYYYHTITRKTQWERPTEEDIDGDIMMDLATPDTNDDDPNDEEDEEDDDNNSVESAHEGQPHTPEGSPPSLTPNQESTESRRQSTAKDSFKHSLSKLVVRCLDHHRKPTCKYGRITCSEDFKHLARKLTFGITEKEITRRGSADALEFNDQVKSRTKTYIKNYMKKFGPIYSHS